MSLAYCIVLDNDAPGFGTFVNGKALAHAMEEVDTICEQHNLRKFDQFMGQSADEFADILGEEFVEVPEGASGEAVWFEPEAGIGLIDALVQTIHANPKALTSGDGVLEDLADLRRVLVQAKDIGAGWHLGTLMDTHLISAHFISGGAFMDTHVILDPERRFSARKRSEPPPYSRCNADWSTYPLLLGVESLGEAVRWEGNPASWPGVSTPTLPSPRKTRGERVRVVGVRGTCSGGGRPPALRDDLSEQFAVVVGRVSSGRIVPILLLALVWAVAVRPAAATDCITGPATVFRAEFEPNDTIAQASGQPINLGDDVGASGSSNDIDFFAFFAEQGTRISARTVLGTPTDSTVQLLDTDGTTELAFDDGGEGLGGRIVYHIAVDGNYFLRVGEFGEAVLYTLELRACDNLACGNGTVEAAEGEECDDGPDNGAATSCCTAQCRLKDADNDGVCDLVEEDCAPGSSADPSTTALPAAVGSGCVILEANCDQNSDVAVFSEQDLGGDPGFVYPFGLVGFTLTDCPDNEASVKLTFTGATDLSLVTFRKFGPIMPGGAPFVFYTLSEENESSNVETMGNMITFQLQGGATGDDTADPTVIVDPGGPGFPDVPVLPAPALHPWATVAAGMVLLTINTLAIRRRRISLDERHPFRGRTSMTSLPPNAHPERSAPHMGAPHLPIGPVAPG